MQTEKFFYSATEKEKYHNFWSWTIPRLRTWMFHFNFRGKIHYTEMYDMLKNMDPPLGFGNKCPNRLAYKKLIRMNMPVDDEGRVNFTTTLFALIRENLAIKMRPGKTTFFLLFQDSYFHCCKTLNL